MSIEQLLKEKYSLEIPAPAQPGGLYTPVIQSGNLLYVSGQTPTVAGKVQYQGKVGREYTVEEGQKAAQLAMLNCLALLKGHLGDLEKIKQFVQIVGYVRSAEDFGSQPLVMNGASALILDIFGDRGRHTRLALGTNELPNRAVVEITCTVEI